MKRSVILLFLICTLTTLTVRSQRAFVRFDRITGSSADSRFQGWSEIISFSHTIETPNTPRPNMPLSAQAFANRPGMITITMNQDITSVYLQEAAASGTPFGRASIAWVVEGFEIRIELRNVVVQATSAIFGSGINGFPTSQFVLSYSGFWYDYTFNARGSANVKVKTENFNETDFRKK